MEKETLLEKTKNRIEAGRAEDTTEDLESEALDLSKEIETGTGEVERTGGDLLDSGLRTSREDDPTTAEEGKGILNRFSAAARSLSEKYSSKAKVVLGVLGLSALPTPSMSQTPVDTPKAPISIFQVTPEISKTDRSVVFIDDPKRADIESDFSNSVDASTGFVSPISGSISEAEHADFSEYLGAREKYDKVQEETATKIESPQYQERLAFELKKSGLMGAETYVSEKRKSNVEEPYEIIKGAEALPTAELEDAVPTVAYKDDDGVHLPSDDHLEANAALHELEHQATNGNEEMTPYAKKLMHESFAQHSVEDVAIFLSQKEGRQYGKTPAEVAAVTEDALRVIRSNPDKARQFAEFVTGYYGDPSEMDARKVELETDAKKLGIWKPGQVFTPEMVEALKSHGNELSPGTEELLFFAKPEKIPEMVNTTG